MTQLASCIPCFLLFSDGPYAIHSMMVVNLIKNNDQNASNYLVGISFLTNTSFITSKCRQLKPHEKSLGLARRPRKESLEEDLFLGQPFGIRNITL